MFDLLLAMLEKRLGLPIDLHIYSNYDAAISAIVEQKIDFARFGPASYIKSKTKNPRVGLLGMEEREGGKTFYGYIIVRADSDINEIKDLRNKTIGFGDPNSTIGTNLFQKLLVDNEIYKKDLKECKHFTGHNKVAEAVLNQEVDAGAVKESTFEEYQNRIGGLKKLPYTLENVTKPWVARSGLEAGTAAALREALLALDAERPQEAEALSRLSKGKDLTGFAPARDSNYQKIREAIEVAKKAYPMVSE
jgi:phosphonate transport system substrate-binding protein